MIRFSRWIILAVLAAVVIGGCSGEEKPLSGQKKVDPPSAVRPKRVVVPDYVRDRWQAVNIGVLDKEKNHRAVYTVEIGSSTEIPEAELTLEVKTFLPAFIMDGTIMTSASNEPRNPGAQVEISQNGQMIFEGWLFSLYPGTHAFKHPRYSFTLIDSVPVE